MIEMGADVTAIDGAMIPIGVLAYCLSPTIFEMIRHTLLSIKDWTLKGEEQSYIVRTYSAIAQQNIDTKWLFAQTNICLDSGYMIGIIHHAVLRGFPGAMKLIHSSHADNPSFAWPIVLAGIYGRKEIVQTLSTYGREDLEPLGKGKERENLTHLEAFRKRVEGGSSTTSGVHWDGKQWSEYLGLEEKQLDIAIKDRKMEKARQLLKEGATITLERRHCIDVLPSCTNSIDLLFFMPNGVQPDPAQVVFQIRCNCRAEVGWCCSACEQRPYFKIGDQLVRSNNVCISFSSRLLNLFHQNSPLPVPYYYVPFQNCFSYTSFKYQTLCTFLGVKEAETLNVSTKFQYITACDIGTNGTAI